MTRKIITLMLVGAGSLALGACARHPGKHKTAGNGKHEHLVCTQQAQLGSHIGHQQCMTEAQYKAQKKQDEKSKDALRREQNRGTVNSGSGGGGGV